MQCISSEEKHLKVEQNFKYTHTLKNLYAVFAWKASIFVSTVQRGLQYFWTFIIHSRTLHQEIPVYKS